MKKTVIIIVSAVLAAALLGVSVYAVSSGFSSYPQPDQMIQSSKEYLAEINASRSPLSAELQKYLADGLSENTGRLEEILAKNLNSDISELRKYNIFPYIGRTEMCMERYNYPLKSSRPADLLRINEVCPIDILLKINDTRVATVFRASENDSENAVYALMIFKLDKDIWKMTGEVYFVSRIRSFEDFENIKVGGNVADLCEIDGSVEFDLIRADLPYDYHAESVDDCSETRMIYKLLSDGVMTVEYDPDDDKIVEIKLHPYGDDAISYVDTPGILNFLK